MFPSHNKAQAEFNWILILIAGTILLIALIAFAIDYRSLSNRKLNTELSLALSTHLDTLTTSGLSTSLNPDGMDFFSARFSCNSILLNDGYPVTIGDKAI